MTRGRSTPTVAGLATPAEPLEPGVRDLVSSSYGRDFSRVRVHAGREAAEAAKGLGAKAFTVGNDVVFGEGAYDPLSARGRSLIAHELAHVAQHDDRECAPNFRPAMTSESLPRADRRLEAQADLAAAHHERPLPAGWTWERSTQPFVATAPSDWRPPPKPYTVQYAGQDREVTEEWWLEDEPEVAAVRLGAFIVPSRKGPWRDPYNDIARAGALRATLHVKDRAAMRAGLWQKRAPTKELRRLWLLQVDWPQENAGQWWYDAGGLEPKSPGRTRGKAPEPEFLPRVANSESQIDHIVELQLGGSNVPENLAPHDADDNTDSGNTIWLDVSGAARQVASQIAGRRRGKRLTNLTLEWSSALMPVPYAKKTEPLELLPLTRQEPVLERRRAQAESSLQVHMTAIVDQREGRRPSPKDREAMDAKEQALTGYPISAGAAHHLLYVDPATTTDLIENSEIRANEAARELIPGLVLERLNRPKKGRHSIVGWLNSRQHPVRSRTRIPLVLQGEAGQRIDFLVKDVGNTGRLTIPKATPAIHFTYPYLSAGEIKFDLTEEGLTGSGHITPSIPVLSRVPIAIALDDQGLRGTVTASPRQLSLPPFQVTGTTLAVTLGAEPSGGGSVDFALGHVVRGQLQATVDATGFQAEGDVTAHLPGLDVARAHVLYQRHTGLEGSVTAGASRHAGPVREGQVTLGFSPAGWTVSGHVSVQLPGGTTAKLDVARKADLIVYSGRGHVTIPGLNPLDVDLAYDGEHVTGAGNTTFTLLGSTGTIAVAYHNGTFTGDGSLALHRDRFDGALTLHLDEHGKLSGSGKGSYRIHDLVAAVGVDYSAEGLLRVTGSVQFPPYHFLDRHPNDYTFFPFDQTFDLFSVPVIHVGVVAVVGGGLKVSYFYGPGSLEDLTVEGGFDPLAAEADLAVKGSARVVVQAGADFKVFLDATAGASARVAKVTGGFRLSVGPNLHGGVSVPAAVGYSKDVVTFDAKPALLEEVGLDAQVTGEIIASAWLVGSKTFSLDLLSFSLGTGLKFGMAVPLHYASDRPLRFPSVDDIEWTYPHISISDIAHHVIDAVRDEVGL